MSTIGAVNISGAVFPDEYLVQIIEADIKDWITGSDKLPTQWGKEEDLCVHTPRNL